jgi:hypothetical protein
MSVSFDFYGVLKQVIGLILICINVYSSVSTFEVLGEFGWQVQLTQLNLLLGKGFMGIFLLKKSHQNSITVAFTGQRKSTLKSDLLQDLSITLTVSLGLRVTTGSL